MKNDVNRNDFNIPYFRFGDLSDPHAPVDFSISSKKESNQDGLAFSEPKYKTSSVKPPPVVTHARRSRAQSLSAESSKKYKQETQVYKGKILKVIFEGDMQYFD